MTIREYLESRTQGTVYDGLGLEEQVKYIISDYDFPHIDMNEVTTLLVMLIEKCEPKATHKD